MGKVDYEKVKKDLTEKELKLNETLVRVKYNKLGTILCKEDLDTGDYAEASDVCDSLGESIECMYDSLRDKEIDDALDEIDMEDFN